MSSFNFDEVNVTLRNAGTLPKFGSVDLMMAGGAAQVLPVSLSFAPSFRRTYPPSITIL